MIDQNSAVLDHQQGDPLEVFEDQLDQGFLQELNYEIYYVMDKILNKELKVSC